MYKTIFMFSGQGSQYHHMAASLFDGLPQFRRHMENLDALAREFLQTSLLDIIYPKDKTDTAPFHRVLYTHPAIFMVQYSLAAVLLEKGAKPDYVLGTSLGEIVAAAVSGVLPVEEAFTAVIRQAQDLETYSAPGGMLAILHSPELLATESYLRENSELAAVNFAGHFVISSAPDKLESICAFLRDKNINYMPLPVDVPFHSSLIDPAADSYRAFLQGLTFNQPDIPFFSCARAGELADIPADYFWEVIRKSMFFDKSIGQLEAISSNTYIDIGPSGTMANFAQRNFKPDSRSNTLAILTPFSRNSSKINEAINILARTRQTKGAKIMKSYVFPGQGSQNKGMGEGLFDEFTEETQKAGEILGYDLKELCLKDAENQLAQTEYTQPALYVVNALSWLHKSAQSKEKPDFLAGHSLGEYNALFAAGVFDFATGLSLIRERSRLMSRAKGGGMAAVIGLNPDKIEEILKENKFSGLAIANYNSQEQIVISGLKQEIEKAEPVFKKAGAANYVILPVSGAFHTNQMQKSREEFTRFLKKFEFNAPDIPVISNVTAREYPKENIWELLAAQLTSPVKWTESVRYLMGKRDMSFEEIGPGRVLTNLIKKIQELPPLQEEEKEAEQESGAEAAASSESEAGKQKGCSGLSLGNKEFKEAYGLKYAYLTGAMANGIASKELVIRVGKAGMLGFFGSGGIQLDQLEKIIVEIKEQLPDQPFGINFLHHPTDFAYEDKLTDILLKHEVGNIEAAAFMQITPALVRYRLSGLSRAKDGSIVVANKILGKISRPEIAEGFLKPAPERIVNQLLEAGRITKEQAELGAMVPMADALCAEADSGGHTDMGRQAFSLFPSIRSLRDKTEQEYGYAKKVFLGLAGGIGTPEAAAAAFILGADFILTGSINQCTVEASMSDMVKDMLAQMDIQDTDYAPAGDMFEFGAKVQVLKKGTFFPVRANKLYSLYTQFNSLEEIDQKTKDQIQKQYFKKDFDQVYAETKEFFAKRDPSQIDKAEKNPKHKMALIFRWYFGYANTSARQARKEDKVNFQIYTGPALGAFNQWVKGSEWEDWRNRHVDKIGVRLMEETAHIFEQRCKDL